jgi:hypothetical protein
VIFGLALRLPVFGKLNAVAFIQRTLDGEATLDGVDDAGKFGDNAVAGRIEDSAVVPSDQTGKTPSCRIRLPLSQ